jgi:NADH-quinone oxidoreductase subunit G
MVNVQIDGVWHQFPKGTRLIEACEQAGSYVPRYCYHKKLSSPGNCRMCLIEMGMPKMGPDRKPVLGDDGKPKSTGCRVRRFAARPMSPKAWGPHQLAAGRGMPHGRDGISPHQSPARLPDLRSGGRMPAPGIQRRVRPAGFALSREQGEEAEERRARPRVTLDDERCILCSRCIRFCKEIAQDDVLGFIDRGSSHRLTRIPGKRWKQLLAQHRRHLPGRRAHSSDFRFKMRVWFLKETKSFCTSCATGCNTIIGSREERDLSPDPRENDAVNSVGCATTAGSISIICKASRACSSRCARRNACSRTVEHAIAASRAQLKPLSAGRSRSSPPAG